MSKPYQNTKPNFLVFMTDQHRADWLGCMGHPVVKTPNLDALAASGTLFTDFHVASPVCMPNRASLMTGRMPGVHGLRYNGCVLPKGANTFVDVLAAAGYDTAAIGKSHLQPFTEVAPHRATSVKEDPTGVRQQPVAEAWKPENTDYLSEQPVRYQDTQNYDFPTPYYGFNHIDMVTGHGDQCGGHYQQWFRRQCSDWEALTHPDNELPHHYTCPQAYRTPIPEEYYPTTWIADRAIDFLQGRHADSAPFFSFVSFPDPHHPFNPPGKYWDMYAPDDFELPLPAEAHQNPTPPMQHLQKLYEQGVGAKTLQTAFRASMQHCKEIMALTAGMITMIDDQIGRVIATLKASGEYENTVILFTSDHGDYMGDFGLMLKGALPFQAITRVPMIWSDPATREGRTTDTLASTIDIAASILDRAELLPYNGMQGESFLNSLSGEAAHRDELFIEYNDGLPRLGFDVPARVRVLRTKDYRFTHYKDQAWGELYDLKTDPNECHNRWDDPDYQEVKAELSLRLINQMTGQMDTSPLSERLA
ncbi:MAG: sulfatase family protein [Thiolinea sp.]